MSQSLGTTDFFTLEAGECLNRLEALLARPEGVSGEEFVRQVRLLRGAALMANLQPVAQAGAAFEALARGVRDGLRPWDAATREMALQVVDDFRALVRRVGQWSDGDTARARRIATDLERM
jgi:chemotaxis protein histidine kinase CheA